MSGFRLPEGGAVDRGRALAFIVDDKPYLDFPSDASGKTQLRTPLLDSTQAQNAGTFADGKKQIPNELEHLDFLHFPL